jgi:hypothetical protein
MAELAALLDRYVELLIMGGVSLVLLTALLSIHQVVDWQGIFRAIAWDDIQPNSKEATPQTTAGATAPKKAAIFPIVKWGVILAVMYLTGFVLNVAGVWILKPAHVEVISEVYEYLNNDEKNGLSPQIGPPISFFAAPLPFFRSRGVKSFNAYKQDNDAQGEWQLCSRQSYNDALEPLIKQNRLLRGFIALSILVVILSICVGATKFYKSPSKRNAYLMFGPSAVALAAYVFSMGLYWHVETNFHETVYAAIGVLNKHKGLCQGERSPDSADTSQKPAG